MEYEDKIYHIRISPFPGGAIITSLDITSLKKAERKYIRLVRATDESRDEIVVFDHKGYVDYANAAFLNSRDVSLDTIIDTKYDDSRMEIIGRSFADKMEQVLRCGESWSGCLTGTFSNGRKDVFVSIKPVKDDNDVVMGYVAVSRPGTDGHTSKADA